ncbi:hypothetical protein GOE08_06910 [Sinorhizobium medicae]|nr:hypothetical protein [Sinorhizobium medicae]MDX1006616.1 hypothetical protein [Sinorhizobium medicae]
MPGFREGDGNLVQVHRKDTGRWRDQSFPHSGWRFSMFKDLGAQAITCQVCQHAVIRYAHVLVHVEVPDAILVGLKCAEVLQDDYYGPEKREREYRTDLRIKNDWAKREWKTSTPGNLYINARGFNIAIWKKGGAGFGVTIRQENRFDDNYVKNDPRMYRTIEEAKLGALDRLLEARAEFRKQH